MSVTYSVLNLIKSYLTHRKQRVQVEIVPSNYGSIKYGVPQGIVLGPILFTSIILLKLQLKVH